MCFWRSAFSHIHVLRELVRKRVDHVHLSECILAHAFAV